MAIKRVEYEGKADTAWGKKIPTLNYKFFVDEYETIDDVKANNDLFTDVQIVDVRNTERKLKARNAALALALKAAGHEQPTMENDANKRLTTVFSGIMAARKAKGVDITDPAVIAEARSLAEASTGDTWTD